MNVFNRSTNFGGGFNMSSAALTFAGFRTGLAFDSLQCGYQQQIMTIYDLDGESGNAYLVSGHAQGSGSLSRVIGPRTLSAAFYEQYSDVCRASENVLNVTAKNGCTSASGGGSSVSGSLALKMEGVIIQGLNVAMNSQEPLIRQNLGFMFISLDHNEEAAA